MAVAAMQRGLGAKMAHLPASAQHRYESFDNQASHCAMVLHPQMYEVGMPDRYRILGHVCIALCDPAWNLIMRSDRTELPL
jgi:hypothetical protein